MRWRLYLFFLTATAAFCFLLLTAATDYETSGAYHSPLVSATSFAQGQMLSGVMPFSEHQTVDEKPAPVLARHKFDHMVKPNPAKLFVPHDADPIWERHETERQRETAGHMAKNRHALRFDHNGWYHEEYALVTAYCPCAKCCGTQSPGITSTGKNAWLPGLAADPLKLDYGTKVFVPGYGMSVVDDTGGAMRRHWRRNGQLHIDVRMTYHYEAREWGKKYMKVNVYDEE